MALSSGCSSISIGISKRAQLLDEEYWNPIVVDMKSRGPRDAPPPAAQRTDHCNLGGSETSMIQLIDLRLTIRIRSLRVQRRPDLP